MEIVIALGLLGVLWSVVVFVRRKRTTTPPKAFQADHDLKRWTPETLVSDRSGTSTSTAWRGAETGLKAPPAFVRPIKPVTILGKAYVIDGDSLRINGTEIRLFGVDAPEFNHPYGKTAKFAVMKLCKGQNIRAEVVCADVHGRTVAKCTLSDGRDVSAEMVRLGLAIDWPKHSAGIYRHLEPEGIRKKLWLADARQKGRMDVWARFEAERARRRSAEIVNQD